MLSMSKYAGTVRRTVDMAIEKHLLHASEKENYRLIFPALYSSNVSFEEVCGRHPSIWHCSMYTDARRQSCCENVGETSANSLVPGLVIRSLILDMVEHCCSTRLRILDELQE
jgi:hypothetical protein